MTPANLFISDGIIALARYVAPDTLFAFDLDGTLAPIVAEYSAVQVAEQVKVTMKRLLKVAKVAVITGRSRKDAQSILGFEPHLIVGNHGAEWPVNERNRNWQAVANCHKWRKCLDEMLCSEQGVEIEFKGESVSIHYRKAENQKKALLRIHSAIEKLDPVPRKIGGKSVVNLLPVEAFTKGKALIYAMGMFGLKRAIYFGDDVTDEEVFLLKNDDIFGIHIGNDTKTAAPYYLNKQSDLLVLLESMVETLELHLEEGAVINPILDIEL